MRAGPDRSRGERFAATSPSLSTRPSPLASVSWLRLTLALAARAAVRPALAADLLRVAWRFRSRTWYRRFPFLPLPSRDYVRWRMHTAYGAYDAVPPAADVERYARWVGKSR